MKEIELEKELLKYKDLAHSNLCKWLDTAAELGAAKEKIAEIEYRARLLEFKKVRTTLAEKQKELADLDAEINCLHRKSDALEIATGISLHTIDKQLGL